MRNFVTRLLVFVIGLGCLGSVSQADTHEMLDPNLPFYRPIEKLEGELKLGGSNTLSHVATVWMAGFQQFYPDVKITIDVTGARDAVLAVKQGTADIGLLSRTIFTEEVEDFQKTLGYPPTVLTPCLERTAIYIHKDNPIKGLTIAQLDAIYGVDCARGSKETARTWGQLGLTGKWAKMPITVHGRTMDTGSQVFLQEAVLLGGPMREDITQHKSNIDMLNAVGEQPGGIGFGGLSYATPDVRPVALAFAEGQEFVDVDSPEADRGLYPLVRRLQLVVQHDPKAEMPVIEQEFIKYVFSRLGQEDVIKAGFQPIPSRPASLALDAVGLGLSR